MMEWVGNRPEVAPAFVMAEQGYDVWLGNNRGNRYGISHVSKNHRQKSFWDWYQEDMGRQDGPTFIDYVLNKTGQENLTWIGHSEGTTQFFLGASLMPDYYAEKVNLFCALAPVASTSHIEIPALVEASQHIEEIVIAVTDVAHVYSLIPAHPLAMETAEVVCAIPYVDGICEWLYSHTDEYDDPYAIAIAASYVPSGSGYRDWVYYGQMIRDGMGFRYYDYGKRQNKKLYGQEDPPMIPIEDYKVPTGLFSGDSDKLGTPTDVAWLSGAIADYVVFEN